jgi:hypothetical protein
MGGIMGKERLKYYPVGNGDCSLITLEDDTTILVDCNIRKSATGESDPTQFDVKVDLLESLKKRGKKPFVDTFILTHGDEDHCRGFSKNFYQGDPVSYGTSNENSAEIFIGEIWFSPMAVESPTNDEEKAFKKEVNRRLELHKKKDSSRFNAGNRIKIIGYDGKEKLEGLDDLREIPGNIVTIINGKPQKTFSIFIHAPFKDQLQSAEKDKNFTSIVFQARFKNQETDSDFTCLAMFGGDADHFAWKLISEKTKKTGNDRIQKALNWDLFLAPHHCSWTFFNDTPSKDNPKPQDSSLDILSKHRTNARVIGSCKEIINNDDNPPSYKAYQEYVKSVEAKNFLNTETFKKAGKTPQPIVFEISKLGPIFLKAIESSAAVTGGGSVSAVKRISEYGCR